MAAGLGLAMALSVALPTQAQTFNDGQKDQIRSIIRDYLLQNPEVLQEAMVELEKKQKGRKRKLIKRTVIETERKKHKKKTDGGNNSFPLIWSF